ncbi:RNA 2',3'-cyclic phosphodiesterase [Amphiplicatus metriothermophilus]|nr:RNA 2',3'-cyclic phosphodiesterase [Amphiplicatus metriothermophilus]
MYRLFVALSLPEVVADALAQLQTGLEGARWRPDEAFHLTLQFIGDADRHGLEDIHASLSGVAAPGFDLTLSGCGFFGDRRPHVLWAGVAASAPLAHLQSKVANALARAGYPGDRRKFAPHVTLAYLSGVSREAVARFCAMHGLFACGPFPVEEFHLYESRLGGDASHYEILETYPLAPSR